MKNIFLATDPWLRRIYKRFQSSDALQLAASKHLDEGNHLRAKICHSAFAIETAPWNPPNPHPHPTFNPFSFLPAGLFQWTGRNISCAGDGLSILVGRRVLPRCAHSMVGHGALVLGPCESGKQEWILLILLKVALPILFTSRIEHETQSFP